MYVHIYMHTVHVVSGMQLLSRWLKISPQNLHKEARTIIEYCRGSPMVIALIGAILKKNPTNERKWMLILEKLKKKLFHSIKLHASVNEWSYQHATLNTSIELSVESLPRHLQVSTFFFSLFFYCRSWSLYCTYICTYMYNYTYNV